VYFNSAPLMPPTETLLNCLSETPIYSFSLELMSAFQMTNNAKDHNSAIIWNVKLKQIFNAIAHTLQNRYDMQLKKCNFITTLRTRTLTLTKSP
jgi:hypothetical protein